MWRHSVKGAQRIGQEWVTVRGMDGPPGGAVAARLRAARGYSGLKQPDLAEALGISVTTLSRMERVGDGASLERKQDVARVTGVPLDFLLHGFAMVEPEVDERLTELEAKYEQLNRRLTTPPNGGAVQREPQDELRRRAEAPPTSVVDPQRSQTPRVGDR